MRSKKTLHNVKKISILIETRKETHDHIEEELKNLGLKKISQFQDNSIWEK